MRITDRSNEDSFGSLKTILGGQTLLQEDESESGFSLLLHGDAGSGKTTLGLHLLHETYEARCREGTPPKVLFVSLIEDPRHIRTSCRVFGFDFGSASEPQPLQLVFGRFGEDQRPVLTKIAGLADLELEKGDLLLVDGVSVLGNHRDNLIFFTDQIKQLALWTILISEEYRPHESDFLRYAVDGVMRLSIDPQHAARRIQIPKLRWFNQDLGTHTFELRPKTQKSSASGVVFYPNAKCLIHARENRSSAHTLKGRRPFLDSGVPGFNELLGQHKGAFRQGDHVLLIGPSDSGKFHFGTQFLLACKPDERALCISFARSFSKIRARLRSLEGDSDASLCDCLAFSPVGLMEEKLLGAICRLIRDDVPTRVYVDCISSLTQEFDSTEAFDRFLVSFLRLLRTFPCATVLVSYETSKVFESYSEIRIPVSEEFTRVIGLNFQEQHNRLVRGIVPLKVGRAGEERSTVRSLRMPVIDEHGRYTVDLNAGWVKVGLLSGEREPVHDERLFLKMFFENKAELAVIKKPFDEFTSRYPDESSAFKLVAKHNPEPGHFSFTGYAGPGHSNTKLVVLRKYVMDALKDRGVLIEPPEEVAKTLTKRFEPGFLWEDAKESTLTVPFYADVGVLAYQSDYCRQHDIPVPKTWEDVLAWAIDFTPSDTCQHFFLIPNTRYDWKNFVSFIFELSWTLGWEFPAGAADGHKDTLEKLVDWIEGDFFSKTIQLLLDMVSVRTKKGGLVSIPDPNIGGHYQQSVFSRRWFSKIHLLPNFENAKQLVPNFGIEALPGAEKGNTVVPGVSNLDLYSIGIIRDALAPETGWMLVKYLMEKEVDFDRAAMKRGLPMTRNMFRTEEVKDQFMTPPKVVWDPEGGRPPELEYDKKLFADYPRVLGSIVDPQETEPKRFRRTADIARFFKVEECLAQILPGIFENAKRSEIVRRLKSELRNVFRDD